MYVCEEVSEMKALCFSNKSMSFFFFFFGEEIGPKSLNLLCAEQHHRATIHDLLFPSCTPIPSVITLVF